MFALRLRINVLPRQPNLSRPAFAKPASFLLVVQQPEEVTLGGLAGMIQMKWRKLHPELEPLALKKVLDAANEDVDLDPDLTVADVWVDRGKQRADGMDQRGTVLVVQKPAPYAPERFPSVALDWEAAAQEFEQNRETKTKKEAVAKPLCAIEEDEEEGSRRTSTASFSSSRQTNHQAPDEVCSSVDSSPVERRHRDLPLSSVERPEDESLSPKRVESHPEPVVASTPPPRIPGSVELGESPSVAGRSQNRKRKQSPQETMPLKQPRLEEPHPSVGRSKLESRKPTSNSTLLPPTPSPNRKRTRGPSFSSPDRPHSHLEPSKDIPKTGLGLGITKSPTGKQPAMLDLTQDALRNRDFPSTQSSIPSSASNARRGSQSEPDLSRPPKQGTAFEKNKHLQSILHIESSSKPQKRRSVSFVDGDDLAPNSNAAPRSTPREVASQPSQNTPTPASAQTPRDTPVFGSTVYPPEFTDARILQLTREAEQEEQERQDLDRKLKQWDADPEYLKVARDMRDIWHAIQKHRSHSKWESQQKLRQKLAPLRQRLQEFEKSMILPSSTAKRAAQPLSSSPTPQTQPVSSKMSTRDYASTTKEPLSTQRKTTPKPSTLRKTPPKPPAQRKTPDKAPATEPTLPPSGAKIARKITNRTTQNSTPVGTAQSPSWSFNQVQSPRKDSNTPSATQPASVDLNPKSEGDVFTLSSSEDEESDNSEDDSGSNPEEKASATQKKAPAPAPSTTNSEGPKRKPHDDESTSSSSEEEESDDDSEIDSGSKTTPKKSPASTMTTTNSTRPFSSPFRSAQSGGAPSPPMAAPAASQPARATLKGLLRAQKEAQATQTSQRVAPAAPPPPRRDVYDGPSSSESEDESNSEDNGDILPNGKTALSRRLFGLWR